MEEEGGRAGDDARKSVEQSIKQGRVSLVEI